MTPQLTLAVTRPDRPLAIVWVALVIKYPDGSKKEIDPSDEYLREQIGKHFGADWTRYRVVRAEDVPSDMTWRGAWKDDGSTIVVDLSLAKNIAHERRSAARAEQIRTVERLIMDGLVAGGDVGELRRRRAALLDSDIDPRIESAQSLAELETLMTEPKP